MIPVNNRLVFDFFHGTGSATREYANRGYTVVGFENDESFPATHHVDVLDLRPGPLMAVHGRPVMVWGSPPCTSYSTGSNRHHWKAATTCQTCGAAMHRAGKERWFHAYNPSCTRVKPGDLTYEPKSDTGRLGQRLLRHTLYLIEALEPTYWIIENPRALMRNMPELADVECRTITHCCYGDDRRMKPTDLFGVFPPGFEARRCDTGPNSTKGAGIVTIADGREMRTTADGVPCHEAAPRGARTGTQGLNSKDAAMLPPGLSVELCDAMEAAMAAFSAA